MTILLILITLLLILVGGFFSGSEIAFTSASIAFVEKQAEKGDTRALLAAKMLGDAGRFLGTTLVGTNLAVVSATTVAQKVIVQHFPEEYVAILTTLIMTPLILVYGELLPKSLGRAHAESVSLSFAPLLHACEWVLFPFVFISEKMASLIVGGKKKDISPYVTREDLQAMAELAAEQGLLPAHASLMLRTVFELDERSVSSVMVPLVDVYSVPLTATMADVEQIAVQTGFSRFPVYQGRVDEIIGVVDLRQLLYALSQHDDSSDAGHMQISDFVQRNIVYIPETKTVGSLLHELRYQKMPMAVVVDEHGGVVGIVTTEDLVEEIVGEIQDERDRPEHEMKQIAASIYECDGKLEIRELSEHLNLDIDRNGFETVAGLVLQLAGHIPVPGERFYYKDYEIEVLEVNRRRVARLRFRRLPATAASDL